MDFKELVKIRQSNRAYHDRAVEKEKVELCLEAGRLSPSANNSQGWTFVAVADAELKARFAESAYRLGGSFVGQAPVIIALVAEKPLLISKFGSALRKIDFASLDIGIAAAHICLQAADLGLGTCMLESFDEKSVKALLNIPDNRRVALIITLGYPADIQREKRRKRFDEVVRWDKYGK
ncbi:MAG: nitroreductase family protein [Tannerellaceae bacterium]|jgi:nitroreductase|nr:nitroreductase family protein [Tannerellaceae bacterium]